MAARRVQKFARKSATPTQKRAFESKRPQAPDFQQGRQINQQLWCSITLPGLSGSNRSRQLVQWQRAPFRTNLNPGMPAGSPAGCRLGDALCGLTVAPVQGCGVRILGYPISGVCLGIFGLGLGNIGKIACFSDFHWNI